MDMGSPEGEVSVLCVARGKCKRFLLPEKEHFLLP